MELLWPSWVFGLALARFGAFEGSSAATEDRQTHLDQSTPPDLESGSLEGSGSEALIRSQFTNSHSASPDNLSKHDPVHDALL
ncbi:MAG: hypothetical protein Q9211_001461 [Gyalolechia sp. 1 TL-2023]